MRQKAFLSKVQAALWSLITAKPIIGYHNFPPQTFKIGPLFCYRGFYRQLQQSYCTYLDLGWDS